MTQRFSDDPFGKRREINDSYDAAGVLVYDHPNATDRGFTGHEHLDDVGIVNMNGRMYDPHIGRFMQADPFIQAPDVLQNYNRYSYVLNNPLNATDPSGQVFGLVFAEIFASIVFNATLVELASTSILKVALASAFGAALDAMMHGAELNQMGKAAAAWGFGAIAFNTVGDVLATHGKVPVPTTETAKLIAYTISHAAVGCMQAEIGGGSCKSGATGAGAAAAFGSIPEAAGLDKVGQGTTRAGIGGLA